MKLRARVGLFGCIALLAYVGCASEGRSSGGTLSSDGATSTGGTSGGDDGGLGTGGLLAGGGALGELPEEEEDLSAFRAPVVTGNFLWFANPDSSRVALISATTLEVELLTAGFRPTYVAPVPRPAGEISALVLNVGSEDATWFSRKDDAEFESKTFETHAHANRVSVAKSGKWAVVWSEQASGETLDPTDGLQDVTLVRLVAEPKTYRLTVGYRPSQVAFDDAEERVIVVAEPGISILDLTADTPEASAWFDIGSGQGRDVSITPSGDLALVRRAGDANIELLPLDGSASTQVTLSGPVTDLDLSQDGTRAVAVVREKHELAVLALPDALESPGFDSVKVDGEVFGSAALSPDGKTAALYTNAVESDHVVVVNLEAGSTYLESRVVAVKAPVSSVTTTPDGEHAIALLGAVPGSENPGAFAVIPLRAPRFPRVVGTAAPVNQVAVGSEYALLTTADAVSDTFEAHLIRLPSLSVDAVRLASPPLAAGILSDQALGYVAQSHIEGRVTILDFENSGARTLTGFELAEKIVK